MYSDKALVELYHRETPERVEQIARSVLGREPERSAVRRILGAVLYAQGRLTEALEVQAQLLSAQTAPVDAVNYAVTLRRLGQGEKAIRLLERVMAADPGNGLAASNLGAALIAMGRPAEAERILDLALARSPKDPDLLTNRGAARLALGYIELGRQDHREAYALGGRNPPLLNSLGCALMDAGRFSDAETLFAEALALDADHVDTLINYAICRAVSGCAADGEILLRRAIKVSPDSSTAHSALLMLGNYLPHWRLEDERALATAFESLLGKRLGRRAFLPKRVRQGRLRVGFVSGDFRKHPVGYFLSGVLEHARHELDIFAYPTLPVFDEFSARIRSCCEGWKPINRLSDPEAADVIRADDLDILIDLSGHTEHNRLGVFALGAAPVQVSWLGYSATTGLSAIDYFVGDEVVASPEMQPWFAERLIRLPSSYLCYSAPNDAPPVAAPPALARGHVTFGCYNKLTKLNSAVIDCWSEILRALPRARLILQNQPLADASIAADILKRFEDRGVGQQLVLRPGTDHSSYLASFADIDIALDPFPFPGGTTTYDALWMGVPTVTLSGDRFLSRAGASFARSAGLGDWIASNIDDYVAIALKKADDISELATLRQALRPRVASSALFDAARFAPGFVAMLRGL